MTETSIEKEVVLIVGSSGHIASALIGHFAGHYTLVELDQLNLPFWSKLCFIPYQGILLGVIDYLVAKWKAADRLLRAIR